tara:strand:- start:19 stop:537 length:519 start_codon:yes stop_codon:yes gene_type:complete
MDINLEDAIDIRELANIKMANQLLKVKRKAKQEMEQQQKAQEQQMASQMQMQSQKAAAQLAQQTAQAEMQSKIAVKEAETSFDIQKLQAEAQLKEQLMQVEFDMQMQLKGVEQDNILSREDNREQAKKERINQQSTNTSKIAEQKKRNLTSINFESNEDSLDGFDFSEFNPR